MEILSSLMVRRECNDFMSFLASICLIL